MSGTYCLSTVLPILVLLLIAGNGSAQPRDRDTLLAIKKYWGNPQQLASWDPATADHCKWRGVTCDETTDGGSVGGVVVKLSLRRLNLNGSVPASVCALKNLTHLELSINKLTGAFPAAALYACARLRFLDLSRNHFSGALPDDIDGLSPAMEHLNLSFNNFGGEVPPTVGRLRELKSLRLHANNFTGAYPAADISELAGLEELSLGHNSFALRPVPREFAKLSNLSSLRMWDMNLTGEIPEAFANLTELRTIDLSFNMLTGSIPSWVWQHKKLEKVFLDDNALSGELTTNITALNLVALDLSSNELIGEIPASIGLLPCLADINISYNQLSGELPRELGKHGPLESLIVYDNNLYGPLPETLCAKGKLRYIAAANNNFSDALPVNLGECVPLNFLLLSNNRFSGDFPAKIWSIQNMKGVIIQNNNFTGTLPDEIPLSIFEIYIGNNMFSGSIPKSATGLYVFSAGNNRLTGEFPVDMTNLANLQYLDLSDNRITGTIPKSIEVLQDLQYLDLSDNRITARGDDHGIHRIDTTFLPRTHSLIRTSWVLLHSYRLPPKTMSGTCYLSTVLPILVLLPIAGKGSAQPRDRDTLLAIKKEWGNPRQLASWDDPSSADHCRWRGVTCDETTDGGSVGGAVVKLSLPDLELEGSVPVSVCALKNLTHLDLSGNNLAGAFPAAAPRRPLH
ncbi:hypothetical protein QOZ80_4AG0303360 [Eleusine coracana subsp. coracana]|nr:hypothetical protein QOZ80_4AG0303360 [Eleusine coracana subsp. coracana]